MASGECGFKMQQWTRNVTATSMAQVASVTSRGSGGQGMLVMVRCQ